MTLLDSDATQKIGDIVEKSETQQGIRLRVTREEQDDKMETMTVDEL